MAILDSTFYKDELKKEVRKIKKFRKENFSPDILDYDFMGDFAAFNFKLERFVFVTSYVIRKLLESQKLSDEITSTSYQIVRYKGTQFNRIRDYLAKHNLENYDFKNPENATYRFKELLHLFVHSYLLVFQDEDKANSEEEFELFIYFNSDKTKDDLFKIAFEDYVKICEEVASDQILSVRVARKTGQGFNTLISKSNRGGQNREVRLP